MSVERERWDRLREMTAATPDAVRRVAARLRSPPDPEVRGLLDLLPGSDPFTERRVQGRLVARNRPWLSLARALPATALLAVAALLAVLILQPTARDGYDHLLDSPTTWREERPTEALAVSYQGTGRLRGTWRTAEIEWRVGTVQLALDPEAQVDLTVHTPEAKVHVTGTRFEVARDARGTAVSVLEGRVEVECQGSPAVTLVPDAALSCLPNTAPGLLGRARALAAAGQPPSEVLAAAESALALSPDPAVAEELRLVRLEALVAADRLREALAAARIGAAAGGHRRPDFLHALARLAWDEGGCRSAAPVLRDLAAEDLIDDMERERLDGCEGRRPATDLPPSEQAGP
ncbi:MAG: FecR domain-containing protein [Deltaproteobacteria bacterium]|nr:FecR domain-containing protein [Deltaproteobacteria bacterium]